MAVVRSPGGGATATAPTTYDFAQLEQLWIANGGSAAWAPTMAAVALAESSGDPTRPNAQGSGAMGLWQILNSAQDAAFNAAHPASKMTDPNANAKAAIALLGNGAGISNWTADPVGAYVVANGNQPLPPATAQQMASNAGAGTGDIPATPQATFAPPEKGVNPANFHGIDLSAIPQNLLGNVEKELGKYLVQPGFEQQLDQRIAQDYGYHGDWIKKLPDKSVYGVLIAGAVGALGDPSTAAGQNLFLSTMSNTNWWKTTSQYQRAWEQTQATDPATAHNALLTAQDKVLATANQLGVKLSAQQMNQISNMYASMSFTPAGTFSAQSGTSQEWLDQAVVDAVTASGKGGQPSDFTAQTNNETGVGSLFGISSQLYQQLQQVAQQYLMYNPSDPTKGLLTNQNLLDYVDQQLQHYTGSGSFGSSNFINGVVSQFTDQMKAQAAQMYPSLAEAINAGTTPSNYVAPTQNLIANTLGLTAGDINFTDPQWNWAIATPNDKGVKTALTQDQVLQKITSPNFTWTDPNGKQMSFLDTNSGQQIQNQFAQQFASAFGRGA